ncbi:hypothetical protein EDB89DRAFT_1906065 [Lactarius sanguifluus]|nr:hypothetical protein EDB89DRAFT_1906065 [Lactarius sanguifluus]
MHHVTSYAEFVSLAFRLFPFITTTCPTISTFPISLSTNTTHAHPRDPSLEATLDNELWYSLFSPSPRSLSPDLEEPRVASNLGLSCKYIGTRTGLVQHSLLPSHCPRLHYFFTDPFHVSNPEADTPSKSGMVTKVPFKSRLYPQSGREVTSVMNTAVGNPARATRPHSVITLVETTELLTGDWHWLVPTQTGVECTGRGMGGHWAHTYLSV